jgi:hypothetical protein
MALVIQTVSAVLHTLHLWSGNPLALGPRHDSYSTSCHHWLLHTPRLTKEHVKEIDSQSESSCLDKRNSQSQTIGCILETQVKPLACVWFGDEMGANGSVPVFRMDRPVSCLIGGMKRD